MFQQEQCKEYLSCNLKYSAMWFSVHICFKGVEGFVKRSLFVQCKVIFFSHDWIILLRMYVEV